MRVLICGAGRVGQGIARRLAREKHDVVIIDEDPELVDQVATEFDVRGVVGHAAHPDVLKAAGAADCEMIIAVTYYDEINMVICQVAHSLFDVTTKIARVRAQAYLDKKSDLFSKDDFPIDEVISPEIAVGEAVLQRFSTPGALMSWSFAHGRVKLLCLEVDGDSPLIDTAVDQMAGLFPDLDARLVGIGRGKNLFAPRVADRLAAEDRAYVAVEESHAARLINIFNRDEKDVRHVVIVGGGNIGLYVARALERERQIRVRVIEADPARAEAAVSKLRKAIVLNGDGLDPRKLDEAGAASADFVIALTNDDKANLVIGNLAKRAGARRSLALINDARLTPLARDMRIDVTLDPRALTVSQILLKMRRGRILALHSIEDGRGEAAEGVALETSPLVGKPIEYEDLPEGVAAAALVRDDEVSLPKPGLLVRPNDHIVVFYEQQMTRKVEQFFRVSPDFF
ncbi:MAG: Trk system potassium transporter TrkA [Pseudomonadota bacterium]